MRTVSEPQPTATSAASLAPVVPTNDLETFNATLRNGKEISIREMTGKDLVFVEEELSSMGETRKSFHIIELLNVGDNKFSYDEIESLGVRDIKTISDLIAKANGDFVDSTGVSPK